MVNAVYTGSGTALVAGTDFNFSVASLADQAGRVSAQIDLGAAPRPSKYSLTCEVMFQATPTQHATLDLYLARAPDSDSTQIDGDIGATDAALGDLDMLRNLEYIGSVVSENAAASEKCVASMTFETLDRYASIVAFNASGATVDATGGNFSMIITPKYDEIQ